MAPKRKSEQKRPKVYGDKKGRYITIGRKKVYLVKGLSEAKQIAYLLKHHMKRKPEKRRRPRATNSNKASAIIKQYLAQPGEPAMRVYDTRQTENNSQRENLLLMNLLNQRQAENQQMAPQQPQRRGRALAGIREEDDDVDNDPYNNAIGE